MRTTMNDGDEFYIWLRNGITRGWITEPFCCTHDGGPISEEESAEFDEFGEACLHHLKILI
jgi:hypothetical protein